MSSGEGLDQYSVQALDETSEEYERISFYLKVHFVIF